MIRQVGDENLSCAEIESELVSIEGEIMKLNPKTNKTGKNVAFGVTGFVFPPLWFFMDLSDAEREEIAAYQARYNNLQRLAQRKNCKI